MSATDDKPASGASWGAPADHVGGARIMGRLGEGSLSEVFRGVQPELNRSVAVKILKTSVTPGSQLGRRFQREAQLLSKLAHQNIPQVFASGEIDGRPFIVLQLVEGTTVADLLNKHGAMPPVVAAVAALKIARALEYVHLHGIVHRDIKPSNVLVSHRGEVKLTDFGIARGVDEDHDGLGVVGTPAYMSPEQVLGDKLDFRSDVFSFGILLYELLTARRPFEEEPARTVMQKIRLDRYVPPGRVRREVPGALERILARCLEKNPAHRYPSTAQLADDLAEFVARAGVVSHEAAVVEYLSRAGVVSGAEARKALGPAARAWVERPRRSSSYGWFVATQLALGATAVGAVVVAELSTVGSPRRRGAATPGVLAPGRGDPGFLRVVARPWARIAIDGVVVETTPTARAFRLAAGTHFVRLTNPYCVTEDRTITIERSATVWLDVDLTPLQASVTAGRER